MKIKTLYIEALDIHEEIPSVNKGAEQQWKNI